MSRHSINLNDLNRKLVKPQLSLIYECCVKAVKSDLLAIRANMDAILLTDITIWPLNVDSSSGVTDSQQTLQAQIHNRHNIH